MYFCYQSENAFISYVIFFVLLQAGHATLLASVCCFVSVLSNDSPEGIYHLFASITIIDDPCK